MNSHNMLESKIWPESEGRESEEQLLMQFQLTPLGMLNIYD